jgi:hypothetical protein
MTKIDRYLSTEQGIYPVVYSCPCCSHSGFTQIDYPKNDKAFCSVCDSWAEITFVGSRV